MVSITPMAGFHVEHFGCRAARADGEAVGERLRAAGHCAQPSAEADVVIVNTCSVTAEADRAARAFIRRAHRLNPSARIVVTGCYAQRAPRELAEMAGVSAVVGNSHKALAPEIVLHLLQGGCRAGEAGCTVPLSMAPEDPASFVSVEALLGAPAQLAAPQAPIWADECFAHSLLEETQLVPGAQTRPNLKIQEGCGNRCSFCVIPQTRGPSKSLSAAAVLRQVEGFVAAGGNELVLTGINLGRWGRDLSSAADAASGAGFSSPTGLAALVREIFARTALHRLRLSSIEPMDWDAELIALLAEFGNPKSARARLARHVHLPLQSGSDAVLRRMHRRYRPWHYVEKVRALERAAGPGLTLGADLMVGFPGETEAEFEETLALVRALPFGYLHLFPFSPRPGTPGWALHAERPVPAGAVEERMAALRSLAAEKSRAHRRGFVGRELEAITLHTPAKLERCHRTLALTENFLPVEIEGQRPANQLLRVHVNGLNAEEKLKASAVEASGFTASSPDGKVSVASSKE